MGKLQKPAVLPAVIPEIYVGPPKVIFVALIVTPEESIITSLEPTEIITFLAFNLIF